MDSNNQYLNELYMELIENTPKIVSLEIPSHIGNGKVLQIVTKQGVILSDWRVNYAEDTNVKGLNREDYLQIIFCLNEGVSWGVMGKRSAIQIKKGESCIYRGHGKMEYVFYAKQCEFHFRSLKIPLTYFTELLRTYFDVREVSVYEDKLLNTISKVSITPYMERILAEIKEFEQYQGGLGYLFLESKILELLSCYFKEVLELNILPSTGCVISRTDKEAVLKVKQVIDSQIAYAPSCEILAKQVHMSVSKLTKTFSSMVGMPIHTYIINQRLDKAAALLVETELPIYQVCTLVGYTKPSNFAAAFKKKYGVTPKKYKEKELLK